MDIADRAIAPWWRQKFHGSSERRKSDELRDLIWSWCNIFRLDAFRINVWHVSAVSSANAIATWGNILLWRGSVQNGRDLLQAQRKCVGAQPNRWSVPKMHLVCPHQACTIIISAYDMEHRKFAVFGQWVNSCWSCSQVWDGNEKTSTVLFSCQDDVLRRVNLSPSPNFIELLSLSRRFQKATFLPENYI